MAFSLVAALPEADFLSWGWRVPFLVSVVLVMVGLVIRLQVLESPAFARMAELEERARVPLAEVVSDHLRTVVVALCAITVGIGGFYLYTTFLLSYATAQAGVEQSVILGAVTFAAVVELVTILPFAALSDRVGRRPVAAGGALWVAVMSFPLFLAVESGRTPLIYLALGVLILGGSAHYGVMASFVAELFPTRVRYSGISLSYQLCGALTGGTAPLVATALLGASGGAYWPVALLLTGAALTSAAAVLASPERFRSRIAEPAPAGGAR